MWKLAWQDWLVGGPTLKTSSLWDIDITQAMIILRKWSHIILNVMDYLWSSVAVLTYTFACIVGAGNLVMHHSRWECSHSSGIGDGTTEPAPQFKLDIELLWQGNRFYYSSTVEWKLKNTVGVKNWIVEFVPIIRCKGLRMNAFFLMYDQVRSS